jgi:hypothetical protein
MPRVMHVEHHGCSKATVSPPPPPPPSSPSPPLPPHTHHSRALLLGGDFFVGAVVAASITKLFLRLREMGAMPAPALNRLAAELMLIVAGMLRLGESSTLQHPIDDDSKDRMAVCVRALAAPDAAFARVWLEDSRAAFQTLIHDKLRREAAEAKQEVGGGGEGGGGGA